MELVGSTCNIVKKKGIVHMGLNIIIATKSVGCNVSVIMGLVGSTCNLVKKGIIYVIVHIG